MGTQQKLCGEPLLSPSFQPLAADFVGQMRDFEIGEHGFESVSIGERVLIDEDTLRHNQKAIKKQQRLCRKP